MLNPVKARSFMIGGRKVKGSWQPLGELPTTGDPTNPEREPLPPVFVPSNLEKLVDRLIIAPNGEGRRRPS